MAFLRALGLALSVLTPLLKLLGSLRLSLWRGESHRFHNVVVQVHLPDNEAEVQLRLYVRKPSRRAERYSRRHRKRSEQLDVPPQRRG
jgi:hypothetical protein